MNTDYEKTSAWDRIMMAITFAEAGEAKTAVDLLNQRDNETHKESRLHEPEQRPELRL